MGSSPFAVQHEIRIDADRGIVDEDLAIDLGEIDGALLALGDDADRLREVERDAEILGEMVERAQRQDAEGNAGVRQHACDGANAAVAAANHHRVDLG